MYNTIFVRLDFYKATISVAVAGGDRGGEVRHWGTIPNRADHIRKLAEKLGLARAMFISATRPVPAAAASTAS